MGIKERKERDFKKREADILAAALRLFQDDNWQMITIDEIAAASEIGKGTVYKHFESKEEIYARLALNFHQKVLSELQQLPGDGDFKLKLRVFLKVFWDNYKAGRKYQRLVQYCERPDFRRFITETTRKQFESLERGFSAAVFKLLQSGIDEGVLENKPYPVLVFGAQSALYGGLHLGWDGCIKTPESDVYLEELTEFIIAGLTRPK